MAPTGEDVRLQRRRVQVAKTQSSGSQRSRGGDQQKATTIPRPSDDCHWPLKSTTAFSVLWRQSDDIWQYGLINVDATDLSLDENLQIKISNAPAILQEH